MNTLFSVCLSPACMSVIGIKSNLCSSRNQFGGLTVKAQHTDSYNIVIYTFELTILVCIFNFHLNSPDIHLQ